MVSFQGEELRGLGFKKREIDKVSSFVSVVSPIFNNYLDEKLEEVVDLCSGNGLMSFMFLSDNLASRAVMYDIKRTHKFDKLLRLFNARGFDYEFHKEDTTFPFSLNGGKKARAIVSIHPCSGLADRVIQIGLDSKIPFALMTCCHKQIGQVASYKLRTPPDLRLMLYHEKADYIDLVRQRYIEENGWDCYRFEINKKITPKNHILVGVPRG